MYLIIRNYKGRRSAYIADEENVERKLLELAAEREFERIVCINMEERRRERLCVNCTK